MRQSCILLFLGLAALPAFGQVANDKTRVNLDATALTEGTLAKLANAGSIKGDFVAEAGTVTVKSVDGIKAISLDGVAFMRGPAASEDMLGNSARTVEAWVYNPTIASEETVFSWGRRGGPNGTNTSFNHGTHNAFGAVGHWGGTGPDIGWDPTEQDGDNNTGKGEEEAGIWSYIAYTYDPAKTLTSVYTNGKLTNTEDISQGAGNEAGALDTFGVDSEEKPLNMLLGSQNNADGTPEGGLRGSMFIARLRVHAGALTAGQIAFNHSEDLPTFGPARVDSDNDGLRDGYELATFGNLAQTGAGDFDSDGLSNSSERSLGTDPKKADTDGDGSSDGEEVAKSTNPLDAKSSPNIPAVILVDLDATSLPLGPVSSWKNNGTLGGEFKSEGGDQKVITVKGVKGIDFDGEGDYLKGPNSVATMEGRSDRTIEAWVHNSEIAPEETVFSWGKRGGPNGTNMSFNHGTHNAYGAIGHWGGDGPDIGWDPSNNAVNDDDTGNGREEANIWQHILYTYDGNTTRVYANGTFANSEANIVLNTFGGLPMLVAAQREGDGETVTAALQGSMTIAKIRVYDIALSPEKIAESYNKDAATFGRPLIATAALVDLDARKLPLGAITDWPNTGSAAGSFKATGDPKVEAIDGVNAVTLTGDDWFVGPTAPDSVTGANPRSIEAWVKNPAIADEETVFAWGRRGGPDGTNVSFNHGAHNAFGAVGHWGGPDIGWEDKEEANIWTHIAYTQDGKQTNVYINGNLINTENVAVNTHKFAPDGTTPLPFVVGAQNPDTNAAAKAVPGSLSIATVKVHARVLTADNVLASYNADAKTFGRPTYQKGQDSDGDGLADDYEVLIFGNLAQKGSDDADKDGLTNAQELTAKTNPKLADTDGDSVTDGDEVAGKSDPLNATSVPNTPPVLLVDLDATSLPEGALASWKNAGKLTGDFVSEGDPEVKAINGVKGVDLDGNDWLVGPKTTSGIEGRSDRTVEAWVFNPAIAAEETIVSWGKRGGPDGTNVSFNHGTHNTYGAVGHWGSPDIGWDSVAQADDAVTKTAREEGNIWSYVAYQYDGSTTRVYVNGEVANTERNIVLNTHGGLEVIVGAQKEANGTKVLGGTLAVAKIRIWDRALGDRAIAESYNKEAGTFGRPVRALSPALVDLDASALTDGPIAIWRNVGRLGDDFVASGNPKIEVIKGARGVSLDGTGDWLIGPKSIPAIEGAGARTIAAWVYNPAIADEETVVSWGRRGGPDGTNMSFNHGAHDAYGAVGHWGAPDIGWENTEETAKWSHIAYTQDGSTTKVYTNGKLVNSEENIKLNTHAGQPIVVGAQWENATTVNAPLAGSLSIGALKIFDRALSEAEIAASFTERQAYFSGGGGSATDARPFSLASVARPGGKAGFSFPTQAGKTYTVQFSEDLKTWTAAGTVNGNGQAATYAEADAARNAKLAGYYRVLVN